MTHESEPTAPFPTAPTPPGLDPEPTVPIDEPIDEPTDQPTDQPPAAARRINVGQLVMGVAFLVIVAIWALLTSDKVSTDDLRWLLPVPFLTAGAIGLTASLADVRRKPSPPPAG